MRLLIFFIVCISSTNAFSEIHREATSCNESGELCFYWWPELPEIDGWNQDLGNSYHYSSNAKAPEGFNFSNAETVIYAKAVYKLRATESKNLDGFIANDKADFIKQNPDLKISEVEPIVNSSGFAFRRFRFNPGKKGNWEQVSYSEETDKDGNEYYLVFVLSSRSEKGYKESLKDYENFLSEYK